MAGGAFFSGNFQVEVLCFCCSGHCILRTLVLSTSPPSFKGVVNSCCLVSSQYIQRDIIQSDLHLLHMTAVVRFTACDADILSPDWLHYIKNYPGNVSDALTKFEDEMGKGQIFYIRGWDFADDTPPEVIYRWGDLLTIVEYYTDAFEIFSFLVDEKGYTPALVALGECFSQGRGRHACLSAFRFYICLLSANTM